MRVFGGWFDPNCSKKVSNRRPYCIEQAIWLFSNRTRPQNLSNHQKRSGSIWFDRFEPNQTGLEQMLQRVAYTLLKLFISLSKEKYENLHDYLCQKHTSKFRKFEDDRTCGNIEASGSNLNQKVEMRILHKRNDCQIVIHDNLHVSHCTIKFGFWCPICFNEISYGKIF